MPFIRLPLGIRIVLEYTLDGEPVINVYHVTTDDPISTLKLQTIAEVFVSWWVNELSQSLSHDMTLLGVSALNLDVDNGEKVLVPALPVTSGGVAVASLPNNVALVVGMSTLRTGRSFSGRSYLAGIDEDAVTGNNIPIASAASLGLSFLELVVGLLAENTDLVVASFVADGVPRAEGVATEVTAFHVNTRVDTQRRRLPKF